MSFLDFKLALFGQAYNSEGVLYAYPEGVVQLRNQGSFPAWINAFPADARFLRELVFHGGECFSTKYCTDGIFYCYTKYNQLDSRNGAVSILLYTKSYVIGDATHLVTALRNLMNYFLGKQNSNDIIDSDVKGKIEEITTLYSVIVPSLAVEQPKCDAYRTYQTEDDLHKYLSTVIQEEYAKYKWIHFIPASQKQPNIQSDFYTELLTPIKKKVIFQLYDAGTNSPIKLAGKTVCASYEVEENGPKRITLKVDGYQSKEVVVDPAKLAPTENYMNASLKRSETYPEEDNDDSIWVSKKALIRNLIALALIALIVGVGISMTISHFVYDNLVEITVDDTIVKKAYLEELKKKNVELNSSNEKLTNDCNTLRNSIKGLSDTIKALENKLKNSSRETKNKNGAPATSIISRENAKKKAINYLSTKKEWGLQDMRNAIGWNLKQLKDSPIEEYDFLKTVVDAGNLDENKINQIITNESFVNDKWKQIKDNIIAKLTQNRSGRKRTNTIDGIKKAFKEANSENGKTNKYENGTVSLETLYKKLTGN